MGREKKNVPRAVSGDHAKDRHKRNRKGNLVDWTAPLPPGLVARPDRPRISSKHKSWFEFIENKDKKKKLEFEFTEKREPPPGFEFVPIGNPALTTACKELSREQGAMIFIVTSSQGQFSKRLSFHLNRVGHHIRQTVVEQARVSLGDKQVAAAAGAQPGQPEPIPERQADIDKQADAAIRDLFPRIPNTDREMIIEHSFSKDHSLTAKLQSRLNKGDPPVGLAPQLTLSRRVQLAVLAHIRHNHTRYDQLLRETSYINARKAVESLCLDILVKWRGDEETGRDQLDEILCEVIVISDSESDESDEDEEEVGSSPDTSSSAEDRVEGAPREDVPSRAAPPPVDPSSVSLGSNNLRGDGLLRANNAPQKVKKTFREARKAAKWAQRGFSRYQAALNQAWDQAVERRRLGNGGPMQPVGPVTVDRPVTHGPQPWRTAESGHPTDGLAIVRDPAGPPYPVQSRFHAASLPSVDVRYERASRVDELQQTTFPTNCRMLPEARAQGSGPAAAPRLLHGAPEVQRVSHDGRDLKDYPVPSIEPLSSEPSSFSPRFPLSYRLSEPGVTPSLEAPVGVQAHSYGRLAWTTETTAAPGFRSIYAEEGFARLPPHASPRPTSIVAEPRQEEFILLSSRPVSTARASALTATSGGPDQQHSSSVYGVAASRGDRPIPQSAPRPVWIGDDGVILRSESRPIIIQDRPVLLETNSAFVSSENRRLSPVRWTSDARNAGASWTEEHDGRHIDSRNDQRLETLPGEFVEIVRVSNKFPRRHEPHPTPAGAGRYDLQSAAPQRSTSQPVYDGPTRYDLRRLPTQAQWVQQPAGTVEQPVFHQGNAAFGARQPEAYKSETRRQERVIGIEYVQARPSLEARAYSDRGPLYDSGEPAYRPRSTSTMPTASAGFVHQPYHPVSGTDEDLMRD